MSDRPSGMSQLDYLWTHFGSKTVESTASAVPSDDVILTEKAMTDLIQKLSDGGIVALTYRDHPTKEGVVELIGTSVNGSTLTIVEMPEEVHVEAFTHRTVTQADIDSGCTYDIDTPVLSIVLTNGKEFLVSLTELNLVITGGNTDSISTSVTSGVVSSHLNIDSGNNKLSVVELKTSSSGVYANLKLSELNTEVTLIKEEDGLRARIPLQGTQYYLKFTQMKLSEYQLLASIDNTTVYFITDHPYIYLGGVKYGIDLLPGEYPITSLAYDADHMMLAYHKADGSDIQFIHLGPASETSNGMMSIDTYNEHADLVKALDGIVDVKAYVAEAVKEAGFSLTLGDESSGTKTLSLLDGFGKTLSSVDIDADSKIATIECRQATMADAVAAQKQGITVNVGDYILITTLTSGSVFYTDINALVDTFTVNDTDSIALTLSDNKVLTADLKISENDKQLYIYDDGVASNLQVIRSPQTITFYGRTRTDDDKIAEITISDPLKNETFISAASEDTSVTYPPRNIDGKEYDKLTNPIKIGEPYLILEFGEDTGDTSTSYSYNDYISIKPILNSLVLAPDKNNLLSRDENGYLLATIPWQEVN